MGAFTGSPVNSTIFTGQGGDSANQRPFGGTVWGALRSGVFGVYTHLAAQGAGTGEINLLRLPPGRITIYSDLSRIVTTQFAANADLHLGFRAYTEPDGDVVVEDDNAFLDNADAGGGTLDEAWVLPAAGYQTFDVAQTTTATSGTHRPGGLVLYAMVDTGNIETDDTIDGWVVWADLG